MSLPQLASVLGVPLLLGSGFLRVAGVRLAHDRLAYAGWAYAAGALGTALFVFAELALGLPVSAVATAAPLALVALGCHALGARLQRDAPHLAEEPRRHPAWERALFATAVVATLLVTLLRSASGVLSPVHQGDEAHLWAAKAKAIRLAGGFGSELVELLRSVPHPDYPLLNPLLQVWTFAHAGTIVHVENRFPIQACAVALVLVLAGALARRLRPALAALLLLQFPVLAITEVSSRRASADLMVALGFAIALDALLRWRTEERRSMLPLASLGLAFLAWSKNEAGFLLFALVVGVVAARLVERPRPVPAGDAGPGWRRALPWALPPLAILILDAVFNAAHGFENRMLFDEGGIPWTERLSALPAERIGPVVSFLTRHLVLNPEQSGFLVVLFLVLVALFPARLLRSPRLGFATLALLAVWTGYVAIYVLSPYPDVELHLRTSAARVSYQSLPALMVWIAAAGAELFPFARRAPPRAA